MGNESFVLVHGNASRYEGTADLVFTHPYAPLPPQLWGCPMILNLALPTPLHRARMAETARWVGGRPLRQVGRWALGGWNGMFVVNLPPRPVMLMDLMAARDPLPGGWFPEELCRRMFRAYHDLIPARALVWDGFMGRGTVGKVGVRDFGYHFFGMDASWERVMLAREYFRDLH